MRRYDNYKDSGIEWIGEIPNHWDTVKLKYRGESIIGIIYSPDDVVNEGEGILVLRASNIQDGKLAFEDCVYVDKEVKEKYLTKEGDILVCARNGSAHLVGKSVYLDKKHEGVTFGAFMSIVRSGLGKYLYHFLNSPIFRAQTGLFSTSTINQLTASTLNNMFISIPPDENEQTVIATYLDRKTAEIDELIADKKRLLELYEEEKKAIINQAVTKGLNPDVPMKESGIEWLGEVPEEWSISPLKYLGKFINGFSFKSTDFTKSGVRVLKIANIQHMRIDWSDESFIDNNYYETHNNFRVLNNDLVFALTRPIISSGIKVALIESDEQILLNQRNSIYRPTNINVKWVYYLLLSSNFVQEFDSKIDKTGQQPNISSNDIGEITIPIPKDEEQQKIIAFIDKNCMVLDSKMIKVNKLVELLIEYRTSLISEVVTGKLKVTE